jgi:hypothetical protein
MKRVFSLALILLVTSQFNVIKCQKVMMGRVLDEELIALPRATIFNQDTLKLGETDMDGYFKINVPDQTNKLIFGYIGYEWTTIKISDDCNNLEVILLYDGTYDFMSSRKIDRLRKKAFDRLGELHHLAFTRGLFKKDSVCYHRDFIPDKPVLDEIRKWMTQQVKLNKRNYANYKIGDKIKIPFSTSFNCDGTKRTCLVYYSYVASMKKYECIIEGQIIAKNRHDGFHNLVVKVIDCDRCKLPSPKFNDMDMVPGAEFEYDSVLFKVLPD